MIGSFGDEVWTTGCFSDILRILLAASAYISAPP